MMSEAGYTPSLVMQAPATDIPHEDDWRRIPDRKAKKRVQNRVAQRSYRQRMKARSEELQAKVNMHEQRAETGRVTTEQSDTVKREYSPDASSVMQIGGMPRAAQVNGFQPQSTQPHKRALSDSDYDLFCEHISAYPGNGMASMGSSTNNSRDGENSRSNYLARTPADHVNRTRAYTTGTPDLFSHDNDTNGDMFLQLPTAPPSLHSSSRPSLSSDQSMASAFQPYMPTPPLVGVRDQSHGSPLHTGCFADFTINPNADDTLSRDNVLLQPSTLAKAETNFIVGRAGFVNDFGFQDHDDLTLPLPMNELNDPWKAISTSQQTAMTPLIGFQASPQSLAMSDGISSKDLASRSPDRDLGRPFHFEATPQQESSPKPNKVAPLEDRLRYVADQARAVGFSTFDDAILAFYNHTFQESSPLFNDQRLGQNRLLPRVLGILRDAAQDWNGLDRQEIRGEMISVAE